jgi:beta-galactosidase
LTTTGYTNTGLTNGTTYYYKVTAVDSAGTSGYSNEAQGTPSTGSGGPVDEINCGGSAVSGTSWVADTDFTGGAVSGGTTHAITTSGVTNPAPQIVYQTGRKSAPFTYTIPGLTAGTTYNVRLHFCEYSVSGVGQRVFNVFINGTEVLTNFDIYADAGGEYIADVKTFAEKANTSGQMMINLTNVTTTNLGYIQGIEIDSQ